MSRTGSADELRPQHIRERIGRLHADARPYSPQEADSMTDQSVADVTSSTFEPNKRPKRKWLKAVTDHVNLLTAVIALVVAILGLLGGRVIEQQRVDDTRSTLERDNRRLGQQLSDMTDDRDRWKDAAGATTTTTSTTVDRSTTTTTTVRPTYLIDLESVNQPAWDESNDLDLDGVPYTHGLVSESLGYCGTNATGVERQAEYSLGRKFRSFHSMAGLSEDSPPGLPVKLDVYADDQLVRSDMLEVGQPVEIDMDVTDVLRLRFVATKQFESPGYCSYVYAALGDPVLR
jgi:hypothetical protein